jgi:hypothetical protein
MLRIIAFVTLAFASLNVSADLRYHPLLPHADRTLVEFFFDLETYPYRKNIWVSEMRAHPSGFYADEEKWNYETLKNHFLNSPDVSVEQCRGWTNDANTPLIRRYDQLGRPANLWRRKGNNRCRTDLSEWIVKDRGVMIFLSSCGNLVLDEPEEKTAQEVPNEPLEPKEQVKGSYRVHTGGRCTTVYEERGRYNSISGGYDVTPVTVCRH